MESNASKLHIVTLEYPKLVPSSPLDTSINWFAASLIFFNDLVLFKSPVAVSHHIQTMNGKETTYPANAFANASFVCLVAFDSTKSS